MSAGGRTIGQTPTEGAAARLVAHAASFRGDAGAFLAALAEDQRSLVGARAVALLRASVPAPDGARDVDVLAVSPRLGAGMPTPPWMARAAESAGRVSRSGSWERDGEVVIVPCGGLVAAALLESPDEVGAARAAEVLVLTGAAMPLYESRRALERQRADSLASGAAVRIVAAANEHEAYDAIAPALCNEVCAVLGAERVALGLLRGRFVRLEAISHAEKIVRNTELSLAIAEAMDECIGQDEDIDSGPDGAPEGSASIARMAGALARRESAVWVSVFPLRAGGEAFGALTVERRAGEAPAAAERDAVRLALDLIGPRLLDAHRRDRWFGARAADEVRRWGAWAVGPRHTWAKLAAIALFALVAFSLLFRGADTASGPFVLRADDRRVVPAPFDGYLASVEAVPGDAAVAGSTVLARLATSELELELAQSLAERTTAARRAAIARSEGRIAEALVAEAGEREAGAKERLLRERLGLATIVAPANGVVTAGDLRERVGGAVRRGEDLFEIADLGRLSAEIFVPEDRVTDVAPGMRGTLATLARPDRRIGFEIESVDPASTQRDGRAVFRAVARLDGGDAQDWIRPGMEGVARIDLGRARYAWLWGRRTVNWLRMRLWL